jgi:hypothetical protein
VDDREPAIVLAIGWMGDFGWLLSGIRKRCSERSAEIGNDRGEIGQQPSSGQEPFARGRVLRGVACVGMGVFAVEVGDKMRRQKMGVRADTVEKARFAAASEGKTEHVHSGRASVREFPVDLIAVGDAELYVREGDAPSVIGEYSLIPSQQPNVVMRVPPNDIWLFDDDEAPWPVVVVDLLDARDDRSVRAANDLAQRMRAR